MPDGASTTYAYSYYPSANTQTATLSTRSKKTTQDGFGRTTKVETFHDGVPPPISIVDTQYAACACSPLGKVSQVSQPYAPGGTPVWTIYSYDGSGRTLKVTAPDGSKTQYAYQGNQTTVFDPTNPDKLTDATHRWKTFTSDAFGNLVSVTEPNPAGGANLVTTYTYNGANQLLSVSMPRGGYTQTRSFTWSSTDLVSATNPENGTVSYLYDGAHHVTRRTDAKGQQTQYDYDTVGRQTEVRHYVPVPPYYNLVEQTNQRVHYYYDSNPLAPGFSQYAAGRVAAVTFENENPSSGEQFAYMYSYNQAGRVTTQRMRLYNYGVSVMDLDAAYAWDNEGRMTQMVHPPDDRFAQHGPLYSYQYDAMGRLSGMHQPGCDVWSGNICVQYSQWNNPQVASASYGTAGEITGLTYDNYSETRTYNSLLQLTQMTVAGAMDMQYTYAAGLNNGRITQSTDVRSGETVQYTYDTLNRLTKAETTSAAWGDAYTYDGFGNLTNKTPTKGSAPAFSAAYDGATNRQAGLTYDANGNPAVYGEYPYDVENRLLAPPAGNFSGWTYDPSGKRVFAEKPRTPSSNTVCELYFYGITGKKLATYNCNFSDQDGGDGSFWYNVTGRNLYFGGTLIRSNGVTVATDRLGSVRANSNGEQFSYFPYGEERTTTANGREKFGTYIRDLGGVDYADQRHYESRTGRFQTADPSSGGGAADPSGWNKYAYVQGDPVNFLDRHGLARNCPVGTHPAGAGYEMYCAVNDLPEDPSSPGPGPSGFCEDQRMPQPGCVERGAGGGGYVYVRPTVPAGNNYTPAQMQALTNGLNNALSHTDQVDCATFYAGGDDDPSLATAKVLEGTMYRLVLLPQGPGTGAQTINLTNVMINTAGAFFNARANANGTVTVGMPNAAGVQTLFTFAGVSTFEAFMLLHELGHQVGVFGADMNAAANGANSQAVLDHCFRMDAQGLSLMQQTVLVTSRILILAALSGAVPSLSSQQAVRVEVQHALATPYRADDPDVAAFKLKFDVRLTNRSGGPVDIPRSETGHGGTTRVAVLGVQAKRPDGRWTHVVQSSWYDVDTIKYESCTSLPPGGAAEFANLPSGLLLLNTQLAGLGNEPTVRFNLMIFCRQPDGKVLTTTVTTDGFDLRLPPRR